MSPEATLQDVQLQSKCRDTSASAPRDHVGSQNNPSPSCKRPQRGCRHASAKLGEVWHPLGLGENWCFLREGQAMVEGVRVMKPWHVIPADRGPAASHEHQQAPVWRRGKDNGRDPQMTSNGCSPRQRGRWVYTGVARGCRCSAVPQAAPKPTPKRTALDVGESSHSGEHPHN